jgi:hypothetical protein
MSAGQQTVDRGLDKKDTEVYEVSDGNNMCWEHLYIFAASTALLVMDWNAILNCTNVVTVVSLTLGVAGVIVGVLGWLASVRGLKVSIEAREGEKTAQDAANTARQELLLQRAVEDFRAIVEHAEDLAVAVAARDWRKVKELLPPQKKQLSVANGSFERILKGIDMDKLDVAMRAVKLLAKVVPNEGVEAQAETAQAMLLQCDRITELVDEIYGKLKYLRAEEIQ